MILMLFIPLYPSLPLSLSYPRLAGISDHDLLFSRQGEGGGMYARAQAKELVAQDRLVYGGSNSGSSGGSGHNPQAAAAAPSRRRAGAQSGSAGGAPPPQSESLPSSREGRYRKWWSLRSLQIVCRNRAQAL